MGMQFDVNACDLLPCLSHVDSEENILHALFSSYYCSFLSIVDISSIYRSLSILIAGIRVCFSLRIPFYLLTFWQMTTHREHFNQEWNFPNAFISFIGTLHCSSHQILQIKYVFPYLMMICEW